MEVKLKSITPDIETNIVEIARVSSNRKNKKESPEKLINYLIKNNHWSPFEHGFLTMEIKTSKAIGIQLLRHRSFTFQEFSQRYAKVTEIEPVNFRLQAEKNRQSSTESLGTTTVKENEWKFEGDHNCSQYIAMTEAGDLMVKVQKLYNRMVDMGIAKECARMILPMSTQTTIYMTGPVRSWIHLLDVRDDSHAQLEIQLIAKEIKRIFKENCPLISAARKY